MPRSATILLSELSVAPSMLRKSNLPYVLMRTRGCASILPPAIRKGSAAISRLSEQFQKPLQRNTRRMVVLSRCYNFLNQFRPATRVLKNLMRFWIMCQACPKTAGSPAYVDVQWLCAVHETDAHNARPDRCEGRSTGAGVEDKTVDTQIDSILDVFENRKQSRG